MPGVYVGRLEGERKSEKREREKANEVIMRGWEWQACEFKVAKLFSNGLLIAVK